jgi:hypothetical protein
MIQSSRGPRLQERVDGLARRHHREAPAVLPAVHLRSRDAASDAEVALAFEELVLEGTPDGLAKQLIVRERLASAGQERPVVDEAHPAKMEVPDSEIKFRGRCVFLLM